MLMLMLAKSRAHADPNPDSRKCHGPKTAADKPSNEGSRAQARFRVGGAVLRRCLRVRLRGVGLEHEAEEEDAVLRERGIEMCEKAARDLCGLLLPHVHHRRHQHLSATGSLRLHRPCDHVLGQDACDVGYGCRELGVLACDELLKARGEGCVERHKCLRVFCALHAVSGIACLARACVARAGVRGCARCMQLL
eukprot:3241480-Rhodomonas_salina.2